MPLLILLALLLIVVAIIMLRRAQALHVQSGLPQGEVIYDDSGVREEVEKPLISRRYGLVGRPDYLVRTQVAGSSLLIPVEVKSARAPESPYESHILQLGVYCLLVEEQTKQRPPHGLLRYADATYKIPFTDELRYGVLETAHAIRAARRAPTVTRSHEEPARCAGCGYRAACGQSLV